MKLLQKQILQGSRSFEIDGELLNVHIKTAFREEKLSVVLAIVNPDPVVDKPFLEFRSRIKSDPMFSLWLNKPDERRFNEFVNLLKQRIREEYSAFTGLRSTNLPAGLAANSFDEPPDFDTPKQQTNNRKPVSIDSIDSSIRMLREHLGGEDLGSLFAALEALKIDPENPACYDDLLNAFEDLGLRQGAVLTYAPYVSILLSDDPFEF